MLDWAEISDSEQSSANVEKISSFMFGKIWRWKIGIIEQTPFPGVGKDAADALLMNRASWQRGEGGIVDEI